MLLDNTLLLSMSDLLANSCMLCQEGLVKEPRFSHLWTDEVYQPKCFTPFLSLVIMEKRLHGKDFLLFLLFLFSRCLGSRGRVKLALAYLSQMCSKAFNLFGRQNIAPWRHDK